MDPFAEALRLKRKALVQAAEQVMGEAFKKVDPKSKDRPVHKAQLSHLVGVCNEAACAEEIALYIRYQASRGKGDGGVWDPVLARDVIAKAEGAMIDLPTDEAKVAAWRLYAVYLARTFTYLDKAASYRSAPRDAQGLRPDHAAGGQLAPGAAQRRDQNPPHRRDGFQPKGGRR
ncbi:hypothetical protein WMF31_34705 [Sorangium sp. So ce1036]|uniref:hypothetical protein n=1 Tax=Sorangium sp. So ce1036 TaxID=3133328 RepID=UPI003EFBC434